MKTVKIPEDHKNQFYGLAIVAEDGRPCLLPNLLNDDFNNNACLWNNIKSARRVQRICDANGKNWVTAVVRITKIAYEIVE